MHNIAAVKFICRLAITCLIVQIWVVAVTATDVTAGIVTTIVDTTADGLSDRASIIDFMGVLDGVGPETIGGLTVIFNNVPSTESFQIGDVVGRDIDSTTGSLTWEYLLVLPTDAVAGTGLTDIVFDGSAFERNVNNLENGDELLWELFLNGSATPQTSAGTGGNDFTSISISLADPGGAAVTQAMVRLTISGFGFGSEWMAARGTLSANYTAVPEPSTLQICLVGLAACLLRRRKLQKKSPTGMAATARELFAAN